MRRGLAFAIACGFTVAGTSLPAVSAPVDFRQAGQTSVQPGSAAQAVAEEVRAFRSAPTLADWKRRHPDDVVEPYRQVPQASLIEWCVSARGTAGDAAHAVTRTAFFLPPPVPEPFRMPPADAPHERLLGAAIAGYLWMEVEEPDGDRARAFAGDVRRALEAQLGPARTNVNAAAFGAGFWHDTVVWRVGDVTASLGIGPRPGGPLADGPKTRVIVVVSLPAAHNPLDWQARSGPLPETRRPVYERHEEASAKLRTRVGEAIDIAAIGGDVEADVRGLLPYVTSEVFFESLPPGDPERLLSTVQAWLKASAALDATRRAAALLVADQVLQGTFRPFGVSDHDGPAAERAAKFRAAFTAIGAKFQYLELGAVHVYTNTWLREAHALHVNGRIGDLVFLTLLEKGFETSGACGDQGGEGFRAVLSEGTAFLKSERGKESPLATDVYFELARASSDIVALAAGFGYEGMEEAEKYKPAEAQARADTIRYYRLALAGQEHSAVSGNTFPTARARLGWAELWRLLAGVPPSRTYFYCVYD